MPLYSVKDTGQTVNLMPSGWLGSIPRRGTIISGSSKKEMLAPLGGVERGNNRVNNS